MTGSLRTFRLSDLWRRGVGTPDDPDNGRLIWRAIGIYPSRWQWHPNWLPADLWMTPTGYLRLAWNELRRYAYETCDHCGRKNAPTIGDSWWAADDATWVAVMGHKGGCLCPRCFTEAGHRRGIHVRWQAVAETRGQEEAP